MSAARIILKPGREHVLLRGHPWLFSGAIERVEGRPPDGAILPVCRADGQPLALGSWNRRSDIALRILTLGAGGADEPDFWRRRIRQAAVLRRHLLSESTTACRMINAEGDGMPGLIVDRYGEWLVLSISTLLMDLRREQLVTLLVEELQPAGIYERSEGRARQREGLETRSGLLWGEPPPPQLEIREHGLSFEIDPVEGQKTGFFLDQRENRRIAGELAAGARILNCFAYSGGFTLNAIRGGAARVTSVELSAHACGLCRDNIRRNGFDLALHPVIAADVFDYLRQLDEDYDQIILDPPAFAKSLKDVQRASRGYKEINMQALRHLKPGGFLATFSCSNPIDAELFRKIVLSAAADAGKRVMLLRELGPGADHPVLLAHQEGRYLKGLLLAVLD